MYDENDCEGAQRRAFDGCDQAGHDWTVISAAFADLQLHIDRRPALERLVHHAITLGELEKRIELVLRRVSCDIETQPDLCKADRRVLGDPQRAAKIEIAFRRYRSRSERNLK